MPFLAPALRRAEKETSLRNDWNQTRQMIKRAETAGCPALVFTVDLLGGAIA